MPAPAGLRRIHDHVSAGIIISYDGTPNDDDALALGKALAAGSASLALAYVRHSREFDPAREALAQHDAERRLRAGAHLLGDDELPIHVVFSASTDAGLEQLAESEGASVIVFGSDYRTAPGRAEPGRTHRAIRTTPVCRSTGWRLLDFGVTRVAGRRRARGWCRAL